MLIIYKIDKYLKSVFTPNTFPVHIMHSDINSSNSDRKNS